MENNMMPLSGNETFSFSCSNKAPCFNECCKDLNQFLTPYDILRLKNHLELKSNLFLEKYTFQQIGPETGLPIISLKSDSASEKACPFVTHSGCSVYENRPSSCRTYPLIRILSRSRDTGKLTEQYMVLKESHCQGFNSNQKWTIQEWIKNQELADYFELNDLLMEIISLKNRLIPGQLDTTSKHVFQLACYDLDTFREHIVEKKLLQGAPVDININDIDEMDDTHLLKIGLRWLKYALFNKA
jgi:Fe-S-cluster containining protein